MKESATVACWTVPNPDFSEKWKTWIWTVEVIVRMIFFPSGDWLYDIVLPELWLLLLKWLSQSWWGCQDWRIAVWTFTRLFGRFPRLCAWPGNILSTTVQQCCNHIWDFRHVELNIPDSVQTVRGQETSALIKQKYMHDFIEVTRAQRWAVTGSADSMSDGRCHHSLKDKNSTKPVHSHMGIQNECWVIWQWLIHRALSQAQLYGAASRCDEPTSWWAGGRRS